MEEELDLCRMRGDDLRIADQGFSNPPYIVIGGHDYR